MRVPAKDFIRQLSRIVPFAATDFTMPIINCVQFEHRGDRLQFNATDRYVAGQARIMTGPQNHEARRYLIQLDDCRAILRIFKQAPKPPVPAWLELTQPDADTLTIRCVTEDGGLWPVGLGRVQADFAMLDLGRNYPPIDTLMPNKGVATEAIVLSGPYLTRLAKSATIHEPMRIILNGSGKPVTVYIGDDFRALQMPIRLGSIPQDWSTDGGAW